MVATLNPLQQGLKLQRGAFFDGHPVRVATLNPLQQGLKPTYWVREGTHEALQR